MSYKGPDRRYSGREICLNGSNETALGIADVTDKTNPKAVSRAAYPNVAYTHQGWLTEDQRYFYMDDEGDEIAGTVPRTRTMIWDVSDLDDPVLAHEFISGTSGERPQPVHQGQPDVPVELRARAAHPRHQRSDRIREVGFFDTAPVGDDAPGFSGSWSNYPYFKSGAIVVTSVHEGLFLVKKRATPIS